MAVQEMRKLMLRAVDLMPWGLGLCLLALGSTGRPAWQMLGWSVLAVAGALQFSGVNGFPPPRLGRVRIVTLGCWDVPLAFFARHRGQGLLFCRRSDSEGGAAVEEYSVVALPAECDHRTLVYSGFAPPEDSRFLGVVPVRDLAFEHRGGDYVDEASLGQALLRIQKEAGALPSRLLW